MEHLSQKSVLIGRTLSLGCIYVLYTLYKDVIQENRWGVHAFLAAISLFFASSVFLCVISALTAGNGSHSVKATFQLTAGRLLRTLPVFILCVVLYSHFVPDNILVLSQELSTQLTSVISFGFPTTFATPLSPVYLVLWLICMDIWLHLTFLLLGPLMRFVAQFLTGRIRIVRARVVPYISGFLFWLVWLFLLYTPMKEAFRPDGFATYHTIGRFVYSTSIRCSEWVFIALAACLSYTSFHPTLISTSDALLNRTSLLVFATLSCITLVSSPIFENSYDARLSQISSTAVVAPIACVILHLFVKMTMSAQVLRPHNLLPSSVSGASISSDSSDSFSRTGKLSSSTKFTGLISGSVVGVLLQCNHEMLCLYPLCWIIAYTLNPDKSSIYHVFFSLPLMISAAILLRVLVSNPLCWLVRTNTDSVDLHVPNSSLVTWGNKSSFIPSWGQYVALSIKDEKSCD